MAVVRVVVLGCREGGDTFGEGKRDYRKGRWESLHEKDLMGCFPPCPDTGRRPCRDLAGEAGLGSLKKSLGLCHGEVRGL